MPSEPSNIHIIKADGSGELGEFPSENKNSFFSLLKVRENQKNDAGISIAILNIPFHYLKLLQLCCLNLAPIQQEAKHDQEKISAEQK